MANTVAKLASYTVGSGGISNVTLSSIPSTYTDLMLEVSGYTNRAAVSGDNFQYYFNSDSVGTNYSVTAFYTAGSGGATSYRGNNMATMRDATIINALGCTAGTMGLNTLFIGNYAGSSFKSIISDGVSTNNAAGAYQFITGSVWKGTAAVSSITLGPQNGSLFTQYTEFTLYGIKNS